MKKRKTIFLAALILTFLSFICCTKQDIQKDKNEEINFFLSEKNISEEWLLFIYAQKAYNYKNSKDIIFGQNIYEYSDKLEQGIVSILKQRYNFNINNIDDFFSLSIDRWMDLKEEYNFIDIRIKYSIAAYSYTQNLAFSYTQNSLYLHRAAQASAFYYIKGELENFIGFLNLK